MSEMRKILPGEPERGHSGDGRASGGETAVRRKLSGGSLHEGLLQGILGLADSFAAKHGRPPVIMEVCGSHTMALARSGLRKSLQGHVRLLSGPGCPVCVTDQSDIDAMIALSCEDNRTVCTFGDMMRVPGTNGTLLQARAQGRDVRVVYAPMDAVELAAAHPERQVVFLGIGFETTLPVLGAALMEARKRGLTNFSMRVSAKRVEPVLRHLLHLQEVQLDGFLLPGHVAMVTGSRSFGFLAEEYGLPGVISGFEPLELASGIHRLLELAVDGRAAIRNDYASVVSPDGNSAALAVMDRYFRPCEARWRGIGTIPDSGMAIRPEFAGLDAAERFPVTAAPPPKPTGCRCGDVIRGLIPPSRCGLFGRSCTPYQPAGPCMVSAEGACAAEYAYSREG